MPLRRSPSRRIATAGRALALIAALGWTAGCGSGAAVRAPAPRSAVPSVNAAAPTGTGPSATAPGDHEVSFVVNGTTTYGTLHIPQGPTDAKLPAALLLPGSGPTDRNGNQPPQLMPDTLADLARLMGDDGIMTLRYDKYSTGQTGLGAYADHPGALDLDAFVQQAAAGYRFLAAQPGADPQKLLITGHSEGALIALEVDRDAAPAPAPAGLALLEPQDMRLLDLVTLQVDQQVDAAVSAGQLDSARAAALRTAVTNGVSEIRSGRPADTAGLPGPIAAVFQSLNGNLAFARTDDAVDPADLAAKVPPATKVMVTCGTADTQVPCSSTGPLADALKAAGTGGPGLVTLPDVDHLLQPAGSPPGTDTLAPAALQAVHAFDQLWH
ncbi:alpha/beta hydrolase family protein [Kitasatospora sp. NPDC048194]|uniref:alpha/beta hydrolase family protein n=1 Tax=Kitasatospora sp. NPDC048194 TaxID=3364045 RepID=UPI003724996A